MKAVGREMGRLGESAGRSTLAHQNVFAVGEERLLLNNKFRTNFVPLRSLCTILVYIPKKIG